MVSLSFVSSQSGQLGNLFTWFSVSHAATSFSASKSMSTRDTKRVGAAADVDVQCPAPLQAAQGESLTFI